MWDSIGLRASQEGLIALTGGPSGAIDRVLAGDRAEAAAARLGALEACFGPDRLYVELQRHGLAEERAVEPQLLDLAYRRGLRLVATNEPFFATIEDHEAHDALICIAEGTLIGVADRRQLSPEHRFKTRAEMVALFADLPESTRHSVDIAMRCSHRPRVQKPMLPNYTSVRTARRSTPRPPCARRPRPDVTARLAVDRGGAGLRSRRTTAPASPSSSTSSLR